MSGPTPTCLQRSLMLERRTRPALRNWWPPSPNGNGEFYEISNTLSHDTNRWTIHLLQRGRPERRADDSAAAWTAVFIPNVRATLRPAFRSLSPGRARLPWIWTQRLARSEEVCLYLRSLRGDHEPFHR